MAGQVLHASTRSGTPRSGGKLLAYARDLLNSDYAGHRLTFQLFAQSPPFAHLPPSTTTTTSTGPMDLVAALSAGIVRAAQDDLR